MTVEKVVNAYYTLSSLKINMLSKEDMFSVISNMIEMRPVAEKYQKDVEEAEKKTKPDDFSIMQAKASRHDDAVRNKKKEDLLSDSELAQVNKYFAEYNKKMFDFRKDIGERSIKLTLKKASEDLLFKLVSANEVNTSQAVNLREVLM